MDPISDLARRCESGRKGLAGLFAFLLLAALLVASACKPKEKPPAPTPTAARSGVTALQSADVCSATQEQEWTNVQETSLGASARDPVSHRIGKRPARKFLLINNWYPLDVVKQTVCGQLFRYDFYDGLGKEADWNNFLIPAAVFAPLLNNARVHAHEGAVRDCGAPHNCFEAEITPQQQFLENSYFPPRRGGTSARVGQPICVYGPWVAEKLHGFRPEIHPSEIVWWRDTTAGEPNNYFLTVQDDSDRFDRGGDFGGSDESGWAPWSQFPRSAAMRVGFEWKVGDPERTLNVHLQGRNVVTNAADGRDHLLEYQGKPALRVIERQAEEKDVGIRFVDVCRDPAGTRLRGYTEITTKVGTGDRNEKEGFAVVRLGPKDDVLPQFRSLPMRATAKAPRRVDSQGKARLLVDLELDFPPDPRRLPGDSVIRDAKLPSGARLPVPVPTPGRRTTISGVPIEPGMSVTVGLQSGRQVPIALPALGIAPLVTSEKPQLGPADPATWESLVRIAGLQAPASHVRPSQGITLNAARAWSVETQITYVPRRDGELAAEDDSSVSDELNAVVRRGAARELSREQKLFSIARSKFVATDLTTGKPVPVVVNRAAGAGQVRVDVSADDVHGVSLRVSFPTTSASHIYRLDATAGVKDVFGHEGEMHEVLWSHAMTAESPSRLAEALVAAAAAIAGVSPERTGEASRLDLSRVAPSAEREPRQQRARLLRLAAERAAEDNVATVGELEQLVRVAGLSREE